MGRLGGVLQVIRNNVGRFVLFLICVVVFVFVLFPLDDLGDFVSTQVAKITKNNVYVRFEKMGLSIVPQPGMLLKQVYVETNTFSPISAQELTLTPSFGGILHQKPYGFFSADGFMKGRISVNLASGQRSEKATERYKLDVHGEKLSLADIRQWVGLPYLLRGQAGFEVKDMQIDPFFADQPDGEISLKIDHFEFPTSNIQTAMGPLTAPEIKLGEISINGRLSGGRLIISQGRIGREGDEIFGDVKGSVGLTLATSEGLITPAMGSYQFDIDLKVKRSFMDKASLILSLLDSYKTPTADGAQFKMRISGANFMDPAKMDALH